MSRLHALLRINLRTVLTSLTQRLHHLQLQSHTRLTQHLLRHS